MSDLGETDIHACLCCGQRVEKRGKPVDGARAELVYWILIAVGHTRESLLGKHRAQVEFQSPGLIEWIEARP